MRSQLSSLNAFFGEEKEEDKVEAADCNRPASAVQHWSLWARPKEARMRHTMATPGFATGSDDSGLEDAGKL